jgi:LDH2 family malate/lactate/ureidoglycolate dehydrogenase
MPPSLPEPRFAPAALQTWTADVLARSGLPRGDARTTAQTMVRTDMRGWRTHGLTRLAAYLELLHEGAFNPRPVMRHTLCSGAVLFDADGALGHVAAPAAMALGLQALASTSVVMVSVREVGHLGALGVHALAAAEAGAFCFMGQHTPPLLAMPGFTRRALGSNPLAFACPMPHADPIVFDMACSAAARGHILLAAREGRPIPDDWALDAAGNPTTDPGLALEGALLPVGGHKGMGIAMLIELLAGAFSATEASVSRPPAVLRGGGGVGREGAFFLLLDPAAFAAPEVFAAYMTQWTQHYVASSAPRTSEAAGARLPGRRGAGLERAALTDGLAVSPAIVQELQALGARLGTAFPSPVATLAD